MSDRLVFDIGTRSGQTALSEETRSRHGRALPGRSRKFTARPTNNTWQKKDPILHEQITVSVMILINWQNYENYFFDYLG
ncbi:MAG: hypothetical protein CMM78_01090 [Rhodospirillaceae bacterium]|nr:hypothetical protein [Rhodospirillales bacterium]MAX46777.1 hypothetical protein [Rhodospirillaceae bacterium]